MSEHPKDRSAESDDPFQVTAGRVAGDPALMLDCIVEEFARTGMSADEILALFESPAFLATHGLRELFGADDTRRRVAAVLSRCGILRVRATVAPDLPPCLTKRS